jgi:hypothetical protein
MFHLTHFPSVKMEPILLPGFSLTTELNRVIQRWLGTIDRATSNNLARNVF